MFDALAKKVKEGGDVFGWAASLAQNQKYQKVAKYFQFKPGIFGATFDVKSALEDLAGVKN
jgi:hypothetical protein